jgi:hypothetical protein
MRPVARHGRRGAVCRAGDGASVCNCRAGDGALCCAGDGAEPKNTDAGSVKTARSNP